MRFQYGGTNCCPICQGDGKRRIPWWLAWYPFRLKACRECGGRGYTVEWMVCKPVPPVREPGNAPKTTWFIDLDGKVYRIPA